MAPPVPPRRVRLGEFQLDVESGELSGNGTHVRLQIQSFELLKALLERPGQMVSRDELRQRLWPGDTFVDFDHGLNAAVRRLREVLGDTADEPRFVETIPRRGYRLVAPTEVASPAPVPEPQLARQPAAAPESAPRPAPAGPMPRRHRVLGLGALVATIVVVLGAGAALWKTRSGPPRRPPVATFTIDMPAGWAMRVLDLAVVSPDSRYIAFTAVSADARRALWVRPLAGGAPRQLVADGNPLSPFWSPDSSRIGYFQLRHLSAVSVADGSSQVLAVMAQPLSPSSLSKLDVSDPLLGGAATWMDDGDILFTPFDRRGLLRLAPGGGAPTAVASAADEPVLPEAIPGTDRFTLVQTRRGAADRVARMGALDSARMLDLPLVESRVVATASGHAVFQRDGALVAQRLDDRRGFVGSATVLADDVALSRPLLGHFSATSDVLVYVTREALRLDMRMLVVDRRGVEQARLGGPGFYSNLRLSPDGTRAAVGLEDPRLGTRDIWVFDLTGKPPLRLTFDPADDSGPAWSQDGRTILFNSDRKGERDLYRKDSSASRPETLVFASAESKSVNDWSPDGRFVVYDTGAKGSHDAAGRPHRADIYTVALDGEPRARPLASTPAHEAIAAISPDGTLVAYHSSEAGRTEVFVETFPDKGGRWQVTTTGAIEPMWSANGKELFFLTNHDEVASVEVVRSTDGLRFGPQRVLFTRPMGPVDQVRSYAPFPDGQRFLLLTAGSEAATQQLTVRVNWRSALPED